MEPIDLDAARRRHWDVIVAGSSFASMFFVLGLPRHLSVLVVEKGRLHSHAAVILQGLPAIDGYTQDNRSGAEKVWVAHTMFGGNSNCWWACTPRLHPADFAIFSRYGVGTDWPIGYDALEPYYAEAEAVMEVSGGGSDHLLPRSTPFPFPPHRPSRVDEVLRRASQDWFAQPCARSNGGSRAPCCGNGVCHRCPIDAKFTVQNALERFAHPGAAVLLETEFRAVRLEGGRATGALLRGVEGEVELAADVVALGANATGNVLILERSGYAHPALGRFLHEQVGREVTLDIDVDCYLGGTSITGHGYQFYDGDHRRDAAAVLIEVWNAPPALRPERGRWLQRLALKLIAEDLPQEANRVMLGTDDRPHYEWHGHHAYAWRGLERAVTQLPEILPMNVENLYAKTPEPSEAHIQGTHRFGRDPSKSVTDDRLKCHDTPNLLLLGAGAFPSSSPANPTLTIAALSLRAGRLL